MNISLGLVAAAAMFGLSGPSLAATYTYQSQPMYLAPVVGGYWLHREHIDLPDTETQGVSLTLDLTQLHNRLDKTVIYADISPGSHETTAVAYRTGREIALQDDTTDQWISVSGKVDSFGAGLAMAFDRRGEVKNWSYWTDGETTSLSLGGDYDRLLRGSGADWVPFAPEWTSVGPGIWTHDLVPVPAPLPMTLILLLTALGSCGALRLGKDAARTAAV